MSDKEEYVTGEQYRAMKHDKKHSSNTRYQRPLLLVVVALVIAILGFLAGINYEKNHNKSTSNSPTFSGAGHFGRFGGQRPTFGTVSAVSSTSITVSSVSGSSNTYSITSSTTITDQGQSASASSIQTGDTVAVIPSSSSSSQASRIIVNPSFGGFGGGGGSQTSGTTD